MRINFLDCLRGILIILVVIGHTNWSHTEYIYWFHMPAYFMLSGALYKQIKKEEYKNYSKKILQNLGIPYLINFGGITLMALLLRLIHLGDIGSLLVDFIKGGTYLTYIYGVFWFITTFAISRLIFAAIETWLSNKVRWIFYSAMYVGAHFLAHTMPGPGVAIIDPWWSPRYFLLGVFYLALGYILRMRILHFSFAPLKWWIGALTYSTIIYLDISHHFSYRFDWKYGIHDSLLLDVLIPCLGFYLVLGLAKWISRYEIGKRLATLGQRATIITYYHLVILARLGI